MVVMVRVLTMVVMVRVLTMVVARVFRVIVATAVGMAVMVVGVVVVRVVVARVVVARVFGAVVHLFVVFTVGVVVTLSGKTLLH